MSRRYGTRSTTEAIRSRAAIATNPQATPDPPSGRIESVAAAAAAAAAPPRTVNGRKSLAPPATSRISSCAVAEGTQKRETLSTAAVSCSSPVLATKRAGSGQHPKAPPGIPHQSTASRPSAVPSPSLPAATAVPSVTENHSPGGGVAGSVSHRPRKRSRLSLGKRRVSPVQQKGVESGRLVIGAGSSSSFQQQHRSSSPESAALTPPNEAESCKTTPIVGCYPGDISPGLSEGRIERAGIFAPTASTPRHRTAVGGPVPPFAGLENLGETCYVNAVLQALTACRGALLSSSKASGAGGGGGGDKGGGEGSVASVGTAAVVAGETGTGSNPVLLALGSVLGEMELRNRTIFQEQPVAARAQTEVSPPAGSNQAPTSFGTAGFATVEPGSSAAVPTPKIRQPYDEATLRLDAPTEKDLRVEAIAPTALVELIREGWLSANRGTGGVTVGRLRLGAGETGLTALADFGTGQACVSELLGKLVDLGASPGVEGRGAPSSDGLRVSERSSGKHSSVSGLTRAFRGTLCARTLCVECERDRTACEDFTELTLPPLLLPRQPPPSCTSATTGDVGGCSESSEERRTVQSLVDAMLGRESLEGSNKVWCEVCRQWTEAERQSSLRSPPGLLALHLRPGMRKQSSPCPYPTQAIATAAGGAPQGKKESMGHVLGRVEGRAASVDVGELVELVLVVGKAARSRLQRGEAAASSGSNSSRRTSCTDQPGDSGDVFYDLIGAILHQGQTLTSGHYTFVLRTDGTPGHATSSPKQAGREDPVLAQQGLAGAGEAGLAGRKPAFALFDDEVVRWLSPEEEGALLRGGGEGLGDPFLVFYGRRP